MLPPAVSSSIPFVETQHGRERRKQRGIDKKDLFAAMKHGKKRPYWTAPNGDPRAAYQYKDITYIVNETTGEEVTCYAKPICLEPVPVSRALERQHNRAQGKIWQNLDCWTTNTVLVVDTSGSMRTADVWGARTRLGAVWLSIALDFVAHRLESRIAGDTDVISIVTLGDSPATIIEESPCTWVLYNQIVDIYNGNSVLPRGHGPFMPSLDVAEPLLKRNMNAKCSVSLFFLSDGVPSDYTAVLKGYNKDDSIAVIAKRVAELAEQLGPRLTFSAIGIGDPDHFDSLRMMVEAAKDYGAAAEFSLPSMTSSGLGETLTTFATTIMRTQSSMTNAAKHESTKYQSGI